MKQYKPAIAWYIITIFLSIIFSILSIGMLLPFMQLIFGAKQEGMPKVSTNPLVRYVTEQLDHLINSGSVYHALGVICILIIISIFLKNFFLYLSYRTMGPIKNKIVNHLRVDMYNKVLTLPIGYFTEQRKGDLISRMVYDVSEVEGSIVGTLEGWIKDPLTILSYLIYMLYLSPMLSMALLVLLPVTALIIGRLSKKLKKQSGAYSIASADNLSHVEETLGGIKVIKAFSAEDRMMKKFVDGNNKIFTILNAMTRRRDLASPLTEVMGVAVLCCILFIGGYLVFHQSGDLQKADLFPFIAIFGVLINPAKNLSNTISNIQRGLGAIARVEEILDAPIKIENKPNAIELKGFNSTIEFKNVTFKYEDTVILNNINLIIEKGKTVALVGSSGAGKSTLADLVPRFYDVSEGAILIDGINIKDYSIQSLRKQMSFVTQEAVLFNDSIANNIALGNSNASIEEITHAATIANAHNFISNKEQGYITNIGDRGNKLSGGERQRVTIARAVLQNPPILILDEATSSLDTESERLVQDAIINLMQDRTSLVIAHRLSTIKNADEIIVMQKGEIIERGTHETLVAFNGFYNRLVEMQEIN